MKKFLNIISIIVFSIIILCCTISTREALAYDNLDLKKIDKYINEKFNASNAPGLGVSIISKDKVLYMKSFGYRDVENKRVLKNDTPLIIGSTTKSFTALAIMQLVKQGKIDLNSTVQNYLPWFKLENSRAASEIKVINLLNHTSGLSRFSAIKYVSKNDLDNTKDYIEELRNVETKDPIGINYNYSNENYQILGLIIEKVSGLSYEEYIKKYIFQPLEMKNSFTSKFEAEKSDLASGYEFLWEKRVKRDLSYPKAYLPCGYIISSLEDMSNYMIMQINNGIFKGKEIIDNGRLQQMHSQQVSIDDLNYYGMGWVIGKINNVNTISYDGSIKNYRSNLIIIPNRNISIVVMSNCNSMLLGSDIVSLVSSGIVSIIDGKDAKEVSKFPNSYWIINLVFLLIILISIAPFIFIKVTFKRKMMPNFLKRGVMIITILNFMLPILSLIYITSILGSSWFYIFRYALDVGCVMILSYVLLFITGVIEIIIVKKKRRLLEHAEL